MACGRCGERGWEPIRVHGGEGVWVDRKGLCPICGGSSRASLDDLFAQAQTERWYKLRYPGTNKAAWWPYDWDAHAFREQDVADAS